MPTQPDLAAARRLAQRRHVTDRVGELVDQLQGRVPLDMIAEELLQEVALMIEQIDNPQFAAAMRVAVSRFSALCHPLLVQDPRMGGHERALRLQ
jgi:hypothetical protein